MSQKLYVGNLPYRTTEDDLRKLFEKYKPIHSLILIADKETERPRGYSFVELDEPKADYALSELSDKEFHGRSLKIRVATGRDPNDKAPSEKTPEKKASGKHTFNKPATATHTVMLRRSRQSRTTTTEYIVSNMNNYG